MKNLLAVAIVVLATQAVNAQETSKPDYSRDAMREAFYIPPIELGPRPKPRVQFKFGAIEFRALGMDWRIIYLPIMLPLSGTRLDVTQEPPNPFELTDTVLPGKPPIELNEPPREVRAELRRIRRATR